MSFSIHVCQRVINAIGAVVVTYGSTTYVKLLSEVRFQLQIQVIEWHSLVTVAKLVYVFMHRTCIYCKIREAI